MKEISEMVGVAEVERRITEMERHMPGLRERATSRVWTVEERTADPKLDTMCKALERLAVLKGEIFRIAVGCGT